MNRGQLGAGPFVVLLVLLLAGTPAQAFEAGVLDSVVSVLPLWPGHGQGGQPGAPPGKEPEGTAVAIRAGGYLVTALHIVAKAEAITVRLADGRLRPAELLGRDQATDLAVLKIADDLPVPRFGPEPALGAPVCAVGNQFGLDLSVTCGVVSGLRRSGIGFNPVEDFIQTDAAVNPGASGGALVDGQGRLVGLLSAIFTKEADANIGVNFAVSLAMVRRVADDLIDLGRVARAAPGMALEELSETARRTKAGVRVAGLLPGGAAERAGIAVGDVITALAGRPVRKVSAALAALNLHRPGETLEVALLRDGTPRTLALTLPR
ncbi:MAG: trypsin-like peptidase domain-containing protein [Rhodospirillales bacterium]|nr:trypsin-like peptidase domain-containing protein [Rhodospirillales bacterium]MDH3791377.1 trypsin-like peptidase domain-containing protein [Rhodospirillales bacterium]MDH3916615.1 trypsin-like peptidase domain-containing protein [Rhodospirillales bacterium]MDH3965673.1 trypsin-like peptidase domain-containing protein [Rhodospirillales bacterium]